MNHLAGATSPYLRQHADNPVDWYPFGEAAFALARGLDRPILISIGYSACHWCHVMAHESFEDPDLADYLNDHFVAVKVDREEQPDVDALYMEALQALSGSGGWPLNVFTTPDGRPFFGGTYFPPVARPGHPAFRAVLEAVADAWATKRETVVAQADELTAVVGRRLAPPVVTEATPAARTLLDVAVERFGELYDPAYGGIGSAPKFPQTPMLELMCRAHLEGYPDALEMVEQTLLAMASGGIYDQLAGGFARYSTDRTWTVPHFEKMLYDQALLGRCYLHAFQLTGDDRYAQIVRETCAFVLRELAAPGGGLYSSLDADSSDGEGIYYSWTADELEVVLGEDAEAARAWYGVGDHPSFEHGRSVLRRAVRGDIVRPPEIEAIRIRLLEARATRPAPGRDDKVLVEWNAMMGSLLAEAAGVLDDPGLLGAAERLYTFISTHLRTNDGGLRRVYTDGVADHPATAADYAWLIDCATRLGEATGEAHYLTDALALSRTLLERFSAEDGGLYLTGSDAPALVVRPTEVYDGVAPSASSIAASALLRLGCLTEATDLVDAARALVSRAGAALSAGPLALAHLLQAALSDERGVVEVVVGGRRSDLVRVVRARWRPDVVLAWGEPMATGLWEGRNDDRAYVCRDGTCLAPVSDPSALSNTLDTLGGRRAG